MASFFTEASVPTWLPSLSRSSQRSWNHCSSNGFCLGPLWVKPMRS